jgi:DNA-binding transcriptional regulator GbsR (MarR family)
MDESETIRRDFAREWGRIGAAWGVAPSTAAVQGYLLLHGGPLTESEIRAALDLSHKAAFTALAQCESWGLMKQVEARRSGRRGPAGRAWVAVGDHWEWFLRVAGARKERETDPVLPLLDACMRRADAIGDALLRARVGSLLTFTHLFDRAVGAVVDSDAAAIAHLFGVLGRLDDTTVRKLIGVVAAIPEPELARAATLVASMRPSLARRVVALVGTPGIAQLVRLRGFPDSGNR